MMRRDQLALVIMQISLFKKKMINTRRSAAQEDRNCHIMARIRFIMKSLLSGIEVRVDQIRKVWLILARTIAVTATVEALYQDYWH